MIATGIVLASASPRRRRLIDWLGVDARTLATNTAEDLAQPLSPPELATSLATAKAIAARTTGVHGTILAFDTIVVHGGTVLGKPADANDARRMLRGLSGGVHEVITGVAIQGEGMEHPRTFPVATPVHMRTLDTAGIEEWIAGGEALGCAGAYNIEHHLASVEDDQCFQNVAGLPLCHVYCALASGLTEHAPEGLLCPVEACNAALGRHCLLGPVLCAGVGAPARD